MSDSENYRAIAPNGVVVKLLDYIILEFFSDIFSTSDHQFAYKSGFSTTLCTYMAIETIQYYRRAGSAVYATLLDATKAFDLIRYDKLFSALIKRKMCPIIIRLLLNLYMNSQYCVSYNNNTSDKFKVRNGVKQGGVMSTFLFSLGMEDLIGKIIENKQ